MKYISIAISLIPLLLGCQKYEFDSRLIETFELSSDFENSTYLINVGLPKDYSSTSDNHDLIIVLDGNPDFETTSNLCQRISEDEHKENVVVVGIMNYSSEGRTFNYTPTEMSGKGGGAPLLLSFITQQLIPELESRYRLNSGRASRAVMGHSLGGLCSTLALLDFNDFFGNFLLLSPSLIWDNQIMFKKEESKRNEIRSQSQVVFQSYGEMESLIIHLPNEAFAQRMDT